jgi:hypothetical protein
MTLAPAMLELPVKKNFNQSGNPFSSVTAASEKPSGKVQLV